MVRYHPRKAPDPVQWLALDEQERIVLAEAFHRVKRIDLPNLTAHAVFHSIIENQIAEGLEPVVRAMARLQTQGLSRHDSLHAMGWVLADHMYELMTMEPADEPAVAQARYNAAVERLNAADWLALADDDDDDD